MWPVSLELAGGLTPAVLPGAQEGCLPGLAALAAHQAQLPELEPISSVAPTVLRDGTSLGTGLFIKHSGTFFPIIILKL